MNGKVLEGLDDSDAHAHQQPSGASPIASIDDDGAFLEKEVHKGLRITFQDVSYTVINSQNKKEKINLLQNVSGYFSPGELSALMGPSGSGKTTLLDVLAGRKTVGETSGSILFSGVKPTQTFLRRFTGYVEQFDSLLETLTVREMLLYTAELKSSHREPLQAKIDRVDSVMSKLQLERCSGVLIGNQLARGISGGQAKRVNIGLALVTSPRVLFLDEPTSGLDSYTSNEVMKVVKDLVRDSETGAARDITICSTIHSPTPYCFRLFDRLLMLLSGQVVYFGNRGIEAVEYFEVNNPLTERMGQGANEAEWIVDLTTRADHEKKGGEMAELYAKSDLAARNQEDITTYSQQHFMLSAESLKELNTKRATVTPFWFAMGVLLKYRTKSNYRNAEYLGPRLGDKVIFSLLIMTIYWKVGSDLSPSNSINLAAVGFMWVTLPAYGAAAYIPSIVMERPLFVRERNDGMYRVITYLCAKMVDELVLAALATLVFSCLVFFPLKMGGLWVLWWLASFCTLAIGIVLSYLVAALSPTMEVANAALPTYVTALLFFAGFLIRFNDIPNYWRWFSYLNFLRFGWTTIMINQFAGSDAEINGEKVLDYYYMAGQSRWWVLLEEFTFFVGFFVLAWLALQYKTFTKR